MTTEKIAELKLECLKMAQALGLKTTEDIIKSAEKFWQMMLKA